MRNREFDWKYPESIVTCEWLREELPNDDIRVFDCTTYLHYTDDHPTKPYDVESGLENYKKGHIPSAGYINIQEQLSDKNSDFSFTIPNYNHLEEELKKIGIGDPFHIVLYSTNGLQWATRVWWLIFIMGFKKVSILDGGFEEWQKLGYDIERGENFYHPAKFEPNINKNVFVDKDRVVNSMNNKNCILINALTADLHHGENPRYGRPGRIPGSTNVPFNKLVRKGTQKLLPPERAIELFEVEMHQEDKRVLNYCGGGIAATLNAFVLRQLGIEDLEIYDNSMSEWAMDYNLPIETDD